MRTIDKIEAPQDFFKYFQGLITSKKSALVWQLDENSKKRSLYRVIFLSARREEDILKAESLEKNRDFLLPRDDLYFYVDSYQLLFKSSKINVEGHIYEGGLPKQIKVLNEQEREQILAAFAEIDPAKKEIYLDYTRKKKEQPAYEAAEDPVELGYELETAAGKKEQSERDREIFESELSFVALDEEDKLYADKRNAPRARPPEGKMVTMQISDGSRDQGVYSLFDLSRGGLSVLTFSEDEFSPGDVVHIQAFDDRVLDEPMVAEVKSSRPADEQGIQFKIGMMFI